jgi:hypothetical protein
MVGFASRLSYGTGMLDWQERINTTRMREERADKLRVAMKKNGVASFSLSTNRFFGSMRAGMNDGTNGPG